MSINTNYTAQDPQIHKMADLVCRGQGPGAIQVLNKCPFTDEQKTKITILINQGPASDNLQQATELMKANIVAALNGEEAAPGPAQTPTQIIPFHQKEFVCHPSTQSLFYLYQFPQEIFQLIAFHIDMNFQTMTTCSLVCKQWNKIFNHDVIWRPLLSNAFPHNNTKATQNFLAACQTISFNLSNGVCSQKTLGKLDRVIGVFDGKLVSCDLKNKIQIWDLNSGKCTTLENVCNDQAQYPRFCKGNGKLVSEGGGHFRIWNLETDECIKTIDETDVSDAIANEKSLVLSTWDGIKVYDLESGECILLPKEVGDQTFANNFVIADGKLFASTGANGATVQIWDLENHQLITSFVPYQHVGISSIVVGEGKLFTASWMKNNKVWDLTTFEEIKIWSEYLAYANTPVIAHGKLFACYLVSSNLVKIWDLKSCSWTPLPTGGKKTQGAALMMSPGKLIVLQLEGCGYEVKIFDFTADHLTIFEEIALALENGTFVDSEDRFENRFYKMPKDAKSAIFANLHEILKLDPSYSGCAHDAFYGLNGQSATPEQKAQAIRDYVAEQRAKQEKH